MFNVHVIRFVAITQVDGKCTSKWEGPYNYVNQVSVLHSSATTLAKCKKACEFDPRCTAVDWLPGGSKCWLKVNGMYRGLWPWLFNEVVQYKLSRCNVTPGQSIDVYLCLLQGRRNVLKSGVAQFSASFPSRRIPTSRGEIKNMV